MTTSVLCPANVLTKVCDANARRVAVIIVNTSGNLVHVQLETAYDDIALNLPPGSVAGSGEREAEWSYVEFLAVEGYDTTRPFYCLSTANSYVMVTEMFISKELQSKLSAKGVSVADLAVLSAMGLLL